MFDVSQDVKRVLVSGALAALISGPALLAGGPAAAQEVSDAQILKALTPEAPVPAAPRTRGLTVGPQTAAPPPANPAVSADDAFVASLRGKPSRSLSVGEREKLGTVAASKPQIDLPMEFDTNSDVLRGPALANANSLGRALTDPSMRGQTFMIAGHTDARGTDASNQKLSERRADAVKQFLVQTYSIPPANLITVGYGKAHLKNAHEPDGRENRRVQAVNMLQVKTAGR
ncbi:OmpA family protein [Methylobacterium sp. NEAU 140]|uniref:OmpA family protein n=1 Tax=Methylobacterium sp. NEAU 140 TaxID=3064945 RepID=UPI00273765D3|nr:OmpA family protein [Methylobacterium sp. NEAU 140]MDP4023313.1 OmpA family protein [Methylobacterium sp. NEAU 140]